MPTNALPFGAVPGFDLGKIQDLTHVNDKYSPALRSFSQALAAGIPLTRGNLGAQIDWAHGHGFANAKQVGDDSIDYGDTRGPIDLIRGSDDAPMFLDKAVWGSAPPAPAPPAQNQAPVAPADSAQRDLVRNSLLNLGGVSSLPGVAAKDTTNPVDDALAPYDDQLRQQILAQMQTEPQP